MKPEHELDEAQAQVARTLGPLDGARIPGGCGHCDAYQAVAAVAAGVWTLAVHHDDDCPFLAALEERRA